MDINSPEYRSLVTNLLGPNVQFEDVPRIPIPSSPLMIKTKQLPPLISTQKLPPLISTQKLPPLASTQKLPPLASTQKLPKKGEYVVIRTGYTSRLIRKFQAQERLVKKGKGKNNDLYVISDAEKHTKLFKKLVFIYDKLWGKGVYSAVDLEETELLIDLLQKLKLSLDGTVVFRVDDLNEGDDLVYKLKELEYCRMFLHDEEYWRKYDKYKDSDDEEESEDRDKPYEEDQIYKIKGNIFRYIIVDSESG